MSSRSKIVIIFTLLAVPVAAQSTSARLARWKEVRMPFRSESYSARERQMVEKLVDACRLLDDIFWRQSDLDGLALYKSTPDPTLKTLLMIMGSRWDLLDENRPFVGSTPMPPGREYYPHDLTAESLKQYLAAHPKDRPAIYDPSTVVKRRNGRLVGVPYREEYRPFLERMARDLRDAAALSDDPAFANFLRLRADAVLSDDYYKSDLAWVDLKNPKFDIIFAPYENYLDELLDVKGSYGAAVLIRNEPESRRLDMFERYIPEMQQALPVDAAAKPAKTGHVTPMEVMDSPYRAGDLRHGYQAVADNLPNDPRIHQEKGTKKIFFKNFMDARVNEVILPVARLLMPPAQAAKASAEGYLLGTVMHEIAHDLGPSFARIQGKDVDIREALGPVYSGLEEAKADVAGMFCLKWLVNRGALPKDKLEESYASYLAGLLRTLRFGAGEAHSRAETMEFAFLLEQKAITYANGRYAVDYARIPAALERLARELLEMEATGDRPRAERWFKKYGAVPPELQKAFASTAAIPVDIYPVFQFKDEVE